MSAKKRSNPRAAKAGKAATAAKESKLKSASFDVGLVARRLKVSAKRLQVGRVRELTKVERAKVLGVKPSLLSSSIALSPSDPRIQGAHIEMHSPMMVLCGEVEWSGSLKPTTGLVLFSSKYKSVSDPSVQVEFDLIEPGKKHLVELYITTLQSSGTYKFRVLPNPTGQWHDESFSTKSVLTEVVNPASGFNGPYSVTFKQTNPKTQLMSWYFHKAVITSVG